jgi:bifunctional non-homologous end joining protein LigD
MLDEYNKKRNFVTTSEPRGRTRQSKANSTRFVVQKHDATRLHPSLMILDLKIKKEGVMKSWAVPKAISLDLKVRRLAVVFIFIYELLSRTLLLQSAAPCSADIGYCCLIV